MAIKQFDILSALKTALTGTTFATHLGNRINFGRSERLKQLPYCDIIQINSNIVLDSFDQDGYAIRVRFLIYGSRDVGPADLVSAGDKLREAIHNTRFNVTNHEQMYVFEVPGSTLGPFYMNDAWNYHLDFLLRGFANA